MVSDAAATGAPDTCKSGSHIEPRQREFFLTTARAVAQVLEFDKALVALRGFASNALAVAFCTGVGALPAGAGWCQSVSVIGAIIGDDRRIRHADARYLSGIDSGLSLVRAGYRSLLCAPVVDSDAVIGALVLASRSVGAFESDRGAFLLEVGRQLGHVLRPVAEPCSRACSACPNRNQPSGSCPRESCCGRRGALIVESALFKAAMATVDEVAPTDVNVLLLGESGTGKELVAREIHRRSKRSGGPLVAVNCACLPRELFESEFFGHVKGAFTGAHRDRTGRFALADGGTLFLDEVAEIPLDMQAKLLRVIQEGRYERVGEGITQQADVRIIAATNRDLAAEVEAGRFRRDLYYRLSVFPIELPPLRDRLEAIAPLARHFIGVSSAELKIVPPVLDDEALRQLRGHSWPGNVRELHNVIRRAVIRSRGDRLRLDLGFAPAGQGRVQSPPNDSTIVLTEGEIRRLERSNLETALRIANGRVYGKGGAAALLGLPPTTFTDRMRRFGLHASAYRSGNGNGSHRA